MRTLLAPLTLAGLLTLEACQPPAPTEPQKVLAALKVGVAAGVTACRVYVLDTRLPRDAEMTDYCGRMFPTPEKALER